MKDTLKVGDRSRLEFTVPANKTVPNLYPESPDFQAMPTVFATGFMVGLMEWGCLEVLKTHLEAGEGSLGIHVNVSHSAATVPGQTVTVDCECTAVNGRRVSFKVVAHDGIEAIGSGTHDRMVVPWKRFVGLVNAKAARAGAAEIAVPGQGGQA